MSSAGTVSVFLVLAAATRWIQNDSSTGMGLGVSAVVVFIVGFFVSRRMRD